MVFLLFDIFVIFLLVKLSSAHFFRSEANNLQISCYFSLLLSVAQPLRNEAKTLKSMQCREIHFTVFSITYPEDIAPLIRLTCVRHFFPATSLPSSSQRFLCCKKIPHHSPVIFSVLLLRDCVTSLRSCKCLPWQPNDVRAKFTCFLP